MDCPRCGLPMEEGRLHTRNYPFWTQRELGFFRSPSDKVEIGPLDGDDTSMFTREVFPEFPGAMLCRACGLVCFSGRLVERFKNDK